VRLLLLLLLLSVACGARRTHEERRTRLTHDRAERFDRERKAQSDVVAEEKLRSFRALRFATPAGAIVLCRGFSPPLQAFVPMPRLRRWCESNLPTVERNSGRDRAGSPSSERVLCGGTVGPSSADEAATASNACRGQSGWVDVPRR